MGQWCNCIECVGDRPEPTEQEVRLTELLERARALPPMTAEELFEQRVSWCWSMLSDETVTRQQVRDILLRMEGRGPHNA